MNASKEEARKANEGLGRAATIADLIDRHPEPDKLKELKLCLVRVQNFVEVAERKLPTEAAYAKDKKRKAS